MAQIEHVLLEVETLIQQFQMDRAQREFAALIEAIGDTELQRWEVDIRKTASLFQPKRRKQLVAMLATRFRSDSIDDSKSESVPFPHDMPAAFDDALRDAFRELSDHHIFQWSTHYRDRLFPLLERSASEGPQISSYANAIKAAFEQHAVEIFRKGYVHLMQRGTSYEYALGKSAAGLQKFLGVPIEFYSAHILSEAQREHANALRATVSSALLGILSGYSKIYSDIKPGMPHLERHAEFWVHYIGFLTASDAQTLFDLLPASTFRDNLDYILLPLLLALDDLINSNRDDKPLPILGQFFLEQSRLEIYVRPPPQSDSPQPIEILCFFESNVITKIALREAANRNASIVICDLKPDLRDFVKDIGPSLDRTLVSISDFDRGRSRLRTEIKDRLEFALYSKRSLLVASSPLTYNFARSFPLQNPFLTQYFRVRRRSVAQMVRTFESQKGVRVWCSVRRSGKTTACFDLGSTSGGRRIVSQTCDTTEQTPDSGLFYDAVKHALVSARDIPNDFVEKAIAQCVGSSMHDGSTPLVFILDEYETLFGRLRSAARRDSELRYTVVQPILNQLVAFSRDHLVVFLGQQPDAHYILMDQNQLSGAVQQDPFPLFSHAESTSSSEFREFVLRVLTERTVGHPSFVDALYRETSGHPFITVNVLVDFVEWLIASGRKLGDLRFDEGDLARFMAERFQRSAIAGSPDYAFFREAIAQATSSDGREENPWLYCVYRIVRQIALDSPESLTMDRVQVNDFVNSMHSDRFLLDADVVVPAAARANFLEVVGNSVKPKIRVLARIAACSRAPIPGKHHANCR